MLDFIFDNGTEAEAITDYTDYLNTAPYLYFKDTRKKSKTVNGVVLYRCTRCGQYKSRIDFYKDKRVPCGIRNKCKMCYHKKENA